MYKTGDRIKNINPDRDCRSNDGKTGVVTDVCGDTVYVAYDDGSTGKSSNPSRYYQIIETKSNMIESIKTFVRNLSLSKEEKLMRKHGLKTECGEYTQVAKDLVINRLCAEQEVFLSDTAQKYEDETKED